MNNIKEGNTHIVIAMFFGAIGLLLFEDCIPIEAPKFIRMLLAGATAPIVIRNAVEATIYFSRAEE